MIKTFVQVVMCMGIVAGILPPAWAAVTNAPPGRIASRLRILPFYERRIMEDGSHFYALRPFYSHGSDQEEREEVTDLVWPLATGHWNKTQFWWRCLLAFGNDQDVSNEAAGYQCGIFPLWLNGRSRAGEDYWALFPIYGHIPEFMMLMSDIDFILFPAYLNYDVAGRERTYYLWPFLSREEDEQRNKHTSVFPFYGEKENKWTSSYYACWPFWTEAVYKASTRNPGESWLAFPFVGHVERQKEENWMALTPFFSWAKTDKRERWHVPWPFVQIDNSDVERKRIFWPFYSQALGKERTFYSIGWFFFSYEDVRIQGQRFERTRVFPFYAHETRHGNDGHERETERENYLRLWPFFTWQRTPCYTHLRTLELNPVRFSDAIERNWAPFWTFYERSETADETEHDGLWGILNYRYTKGLATNASPAGSILPVKGTPSNKRLVTGLEEEMDGLLK